MIFKIENRDFHCYDDDKEVQRGSKMIFYGEYGAKELPKTAEVVLDIGANIGAFAVWALAKWPDSLIYSFEPSPANFHYLKLNTPDKNVTHLPVAVTKQGGTARLFKGMHNNGEHSLYDVGEQKTDESIEVGLYPAALLPKADVVKIDTEGCEVEILSNYHHLSTVNAVMLEWHRTEDKPVLEELLTSVGLHKVKDDRRCATRGVLVYVR